MEPHVYERMARIQDRHWWFRGRRRILAALLSRLGLPPSARILELGCGPGGNLPMLGGFGSVSAIEPEAEARRVAAGKGPFDVREGRLPDAIPFPPGSFDLVLMLDVLEHLDDDAGALEAAARMLAPGGRIIVTVPAFAFLWSDHDVQHHHKRRYQAKQVASIARKAGLEPLCLTYFNCALFPIAAALRAAKRMLGRGGNEDAMPPAAINSILEAVFAAERHAIGRVPLPFGLSVAAVLRSTGRAPSPPRATRQAWALPPDAADSQAAARRL